MQELTFTDADVGKNVVSADGETLGIVTEVRHGTAYVDPDPSLFDTLKATLGWEDVDEDSYPLQKADVASVTDDEIRLERRALAEEM